MAGKYYEELEVGQRIQHTQGRTITEADNVLFCALTANGQALHVNHDFAARSEFGRPLVNGMLSFALTVGLTVNDLTDSTIVANLGYDAIRHPSPLFHGDTLYVETEVMAKRDSRSRPNCGIVTLRHIARKPDGTVVVDVTRSVLFLKREETP